MFFSPRCSMASLLQGFVHNQALAPSRRASRDLLTLLRGWLAGRPAAWCVRVRGHRQPTPNSPLSDVVLKSLPYILPLSHKSGSYGLLIFRVCTLFRSSNGWVRWKDMVQFNRLQTRCTPCKPCPSPFFFVSRCFFFLGRSNVRSFGQSTLPKTATEHPPQP